MDERKITRADLEAMRQEYGLSRVQEPGGGLPYSLDDDLKQVGIFEFGKITLERWAEMRGVPVDYARALRRYLMKK